jgi:hypothetical protein
MKKTLWFVVGALLVLSVIGCPNDASSDTEDDHDSSANSTLLTIKNQSFSDLLNVEWQGVSFALSFTENFIPIGNKVTAPVSAGSGYIYFRRKSNPAFARTKETVIVEQDERPEFTFTDNTLIVDTNDPNNTGTLKDMLTTVVFFDDAEWEIQNYAERKGCTYYSVILGDNVSYHSPYEDKGKSIALGGQADAKLRLSLNLGRKAKFSFKYANKDGLTYGGGTISIDGIQKAAWEGNYDWSSLEYTLEAGSHEIEWTKNGFYMYGAELHYSYLSLDEILVYYTE